MPERRFSLSLPAQVRSRTQLSLGDLKSQLGHIATPAPVKPVLYPWVLGFAEERSRHPVAHRIDQQIKSKRLQEMVDFFENVRGRARLGISPFGHLKFESDFYRSRWRTWMHQQNEAAPSSETSSSRV
jgi:hypothetical protein